MAETKNGWRFLDALYESEWIQEKSLCLQNRRHTCPKNCLAALHHRSIFPSWTAYDDLEICGYLTPKEVVHLTSFLPVLKNAAKPNDELFPIFADRLERSAKVGAGLITIQSGL